MVINKKISLVIPCHNEEKGLKEMLRNVPAAIDEIIVVDNNSTDKTAVVARSAGATLVTERKPGYGAAMKTGINKATGDIIITMDGDNTYPLECCEMLAEQLIVSKMDFISGCRFPLKNAQAMNWINRAGNIVLSLTGRWLFNFSLKDSQSGMWVFRRDILKNIILESDGMALSQEFKIKTITGGLFFEEVHIPYEQRVGNSKLSRFRDGFLNLFNLFKLRLQKR